jgi:hypothetical protein
MDEGRKRVLVIAASILAARRLAQLEFKPCPAYEAVIANAIAAAEKIMRRIDSHWPAPDRHRDF